MLGVSSAPLQGDWLSYTHGCATAGEGTNPDLCIPSLVMTSKRTTVHTQCNTEVAVEMSHTQGSSAFFKCKTEYSTREVQGGSQGPEGLTVHLINHSQHPSAHRILLTSHELCPSIARTKHSVFPTLNDRVWTDTLIICFLVAFRLRWKFVSFYFNLPFGFCLESGLNSLLTM